MDTTGPALAIVEETGAMQEHRPPSCSSDRTLPSEVW